MEWIQSKRPVDYSHAVQTMEERVAGIINGDEHEAVWCLEHPPLYTAGTSADSADLLEAKFPVHKTGRGGEYTYHGPGQLVGYLILDLNKRGMKDLRRFVWTIEEWLIRSLYDLGVTAGRRDGRIGLWVDMADYGGEAGDDAKIAAIGVRVRQWVTYHGFALNINPDLSHFDGIVPCGIREHGVTSLHDLGITVERRDVITSLKHHFSDLF